MLNSVHTKVNSGLFRERMNLNNNYLMELESKYLLQNFYMEAGIFVPELQVVKEPEKLNSHWGWEAPTCQLRGHFLGHWMSAAAKVVASEGNVELKQKLDYIISELAKCQQKNGGEWIGSIPEKYFSFMVNGEPVWSPQYTLHKTVMGLVDAYRYTKNEQALEILDHLADWYLKWLDGNSYRAMYGEEGGMLEEWVELYSITSDPRYKTLIDYYTSYDVYNNMLNGTDIFTDLHTNNLIPYFHGAARLYETSSNEYFKNATEAFWNNAVTNRGMYSTTGQNAGEFGIGPWEQMHFLGDHTQEFCTVYNMVRTADYLFRWSHDVKYLDYIERAIYNGFLAQQNKKTGMVAYFLPLGMGSKKEWCTKRNDFWCCLGAMVQAQALYPELITYQDKENTTIYVAQYIPSTSDIEVNYNPVVIQIGQVIANKDTNYLEILGDHEKSMWAFQIDVLTNNPVYFKLALRVPSWADSYSIKINGEELNIDKIDGFIYIEREWNNEKIDIRFKTHVYEESLPNSNELSCIIDGPVVLGGLIDYDCGLDGNLNDIMVWTTEHKYNTIPWIQNQYFTVNQNHNFKLVPLYDITDETYTVYFSRKRK